MSIPFLNSSVIRYLETYFDYELHVLFVLFFIIIIIIEKINQSNNLPLATNPIM
ncbi:MAG: hypothetical protein KatS3mg089_0226 [Patescibacteria group bacterium]|nr:MAG: hypothetical protein KatS3mg089_0226 [Patescibacteria group bacterium]